MSDTNIAPEPLEQENGESIIGDRLLSRVILALEVLGLTDGRPTPAEARELSVKLRAFRQYYGAMAKLPRPVIPTNGPISAEQAEIARLRLHLRRCYGSMVEATAAVLKLRTWGEAMSAPDSYTLDEELAALALGMREDADKIMRSVRDDE